MKPIRVCIFCERWGSGGIESFISNVLLHMDLHEMEVDIVAACINDSVFTSGLKEKGVRFIELSGKLRSIKNNRRFLDLLHKRKYDVAHFNLFQGLSLYYVHLAKKAGVPTRIVHSHGAGLRNSRTKVAKLTLHKVGRSLWQDDATDLWACSQPAAKFLFGHKSYCSIPNGIDLEKFRFCDAKRECTRKDLGISEKVVIGTVGRLSQEKNHEFLLNVFQKYHSKDSNSVLLLVGDGEDRERLLALAEVLGISESVIFYGTSPHVDDLLCAMDVFVFPSIFEGWGIAGVEAQAAGLPVLCSEGVPKAIHITDAIKSMPRTDAGAWAEEITRLLNKAIDRQTATDQVKCAGVDILSVANRIFEKYMEQRNG